MKNILACICISAIGLFVSAQHKESISGFVYDENTGEVLIGATVFEKQYNKGTITNEYGFYSLTVPSQDSLEISVSYLGYQQLDTTISITRNHFDFSLKPGISVEKVSVSTDNIVHRNETGVVRLPMKDIQSLPNLFGEVDIIKAYQLTPGVQSGGEAKSNLFVRGGSADQNLILLDDVPLYYVAHFGGFFSVFNADAINHVKLVKGGFPAHYGSRLSSVLDIRMKEGNMQEFAVQGTAGLLSSKVSVEGPIVKDKMSYIISARKNLLPLFRLFDTGLSYNFYDVNTKFNFRLSDKNKFFASFYMGDDFLKLKSKNDIINHKNTLKWGNTLFSLRWNHVYNNKLFSNLTLSNTYYRNKNSFNYELTTDSITKNMHNALLSGINDVMIKLDYNYVLNSNIHFKFGANSTYHTFIPNDETFSQSGTDIESIEQDYTSKLYAFENAVYLENLLKLGPLNTNLGLRYSSYFIGQTDYTSLKPRLLFNFILREDLSLKYSYSAMNQYIHLLAYSGTGVPTDYWMPSNENVKPEQSVQHSAGIAKTFIDGIYELSLEAYHKTLNNQIAFIPGESLMGNFGSWENVIELGGVGENYGIEFFLQKKSGKTTGWLGVTLAKATRKFDNLNGAQAYPFKYDRLLDGSIVMNHKLKENIVLSGTWTYGTGYPVTLATEHYYINGEEIFVYGEKNGHRMRDYHRLDVAAHFTRKTKWGERTWTISIFNLYNRQNPYYYYYEHDVTFESTPGGGYFYDKLGELKLYQRSLFSIFPSIAYSFKF